MLLNLSMVTDVLALGTHEIKFLIRTDVPTRQRLSAFLSVMQALIVCSYNIHHKVQYNI